MVGIKKWIKDNRGIEGLPMHLIIIVVIAGATLGLILYWFSMANPNHLHYTVEPSSIEITQNPQIISVTVTVTDDHNNPVKGALVHIWGYGGNIANKTNESGKTKLTIQVNVPENTHEGWLEMSISHAGYDNSPIKEEHAVLLYS
ncbi:MAG: hypothetical protein J7K61_05725 [Thermoplasmata archaeon]|nr:hypothetical protein [Thermoplasmata archaeon]